MKPHFSMINVSSTVCARTMKGVRVPLMSFTQWMQPSRSSSTSLSHIIRTKLEAPGHLLPFERILTSQIDRTVETSDRIGKVLNFSASDYLGLSKHPEVIAATKRAVDTHGVGMSASRAVCGTQNIHKELELKLAKFHGREGAILYPSCFAANTGFFETLLDEKDVIISDQLNHVSIIIGVQLCKAQKRIYKHLDMEGLEKHLSESQDARLRLIVTDGVFSMDADVTPFDKICQLADKYDALIFMDEAHAAGCLGSSGRGTEEHFNMIGRADFISSSLSKALGGGVGGGYVTGSQSIIDFLKYKSRPYIFTNSPPPCVVACASKTVDIVTENPDLVTAMYRNSEHFRKEITKAGFTVGGNIVHPVCPVQLKDGDLSDRVANKLYDRGFLVLSVHYPFIQKGEAIVRVQISASHTLEDIDRLVEAFVEVVQSEEIIQTEEKCLQLLRN